MCAFRVRQNNPFCMLKRSTTPLFGNEQYEGYSIDLLHKLATKLGFKYKVRIVADGKYGNEKNGEWNGMVKEVLDGEADVIIADLTVNKVRQQAVDFTMPFMVKPISRLDLPYNIILSTSLSLQFTFSPEPWNFYSPYETESQASKFVLFPVTFLH
jgi:hypothetical protein